MRLGIRGTTGRWLTLDGCRGIALLERRVRHNLRPSFAGDREHGFSSTAVLPTVGLTHAAVNKVQAAARRMSALRAVHLWDCSTHLFGGAGRPNVLPGHCPCHGEDAGENAGLH